MVSFEANHRDFLPGTKLEFGFLGDQFLLRCFLGEIYQDNESDERKLKLKITYR